MWVNHENIARSTAEEEWHPLKPFLPENAKVLFLGSFPPPRQRWCIDFYYPNFINDHWRIEGLVWFHDKDHFIIGKRFDLNRIVEFCRQKGLAFHDTATAVRRLKGNASDKDLEVIVPTDIRALISRLPQLRCIVTTGERATQTICNELGISKMPAVGEYITAPIVLKAQAGGRTEEANREGQMAADDERTGAQAGRTEGLMIYRLPSSSRAYPLKLENKAEAYGKMFRTVFGTDN